MIQFLSQRVKRGWDVYSQKPFPRLVRLFVGRVFHGSGESGEGELDLSLGLFLSLLALPGGFYSILLLEKYATLLQWMREQHEFDRLAGALPDEYFFIVLSMAVTGVVAVWRWDSIFPDRRDYANLVPLPISMRDIFLANLTAIVFLALVLALDVNAASAVLFPVAVSAAEHEVGFFAQFVGVHTFVVVLASVFSFFAVFASVGVLMLTLPYRAFRRISLYLRGVIIAAFIAMLATSFEVPAMLRQLPEAWVRFLPPVWFLGLCQLLRGKASPELAVLGRTALIASGTIIAFSVVIYALSYRRCFSRIPEAADAGPVQRRTHLAWIFPILDRTILRSPFQRAGYRFVMKTLLRSEQHALVLGGFLGLGIVTASQFLFASQVGSTVERGNPLSPEILAIPLILSYCIILGVRFVFDIPAEMRANWVFRLCLDRDNHECISLARKVTMTFVLPWVFAVVLPVYGYLWGWRVGLLQMAVVTIMSALLAELLLVRFRKMPFTCVYPMFRPSAVVFVMAYVLGFLVFVVLTSNLASWALLQPVLIVPFIAVTFIARLVLSRFQKGVQEIDKQLIFEETASADFELLNLSRGI